MFFRLRFKLVLLVASLLLYSSLGYCVSILRDIKKDKNEISIIFDKEIFSREVKVEFLRDIIQFSIAQSSVYPAKIIAFEDNKIKKAFAYQYSPQVIRIRLTVDGEAEKYKNSFQYKINKNKIMASLPVSQVVTETREELKTPVSANIPVEAPTKKNDKIESPLLKKDFKQDVSLRDQFMKVLYRLGVFILLILMLAVVYRKFSGKKKIKGNYKRENSTFSIISSFLTNKLRPQSEFMEVIATHPLSPKKSIMVVKIKEETLVLGVSEESINLITKLKKGESFEEAFVQDSPMDPEPFKQIFNQEVRSEATPKPIVQHRSHSMISSDVRDRIRKKIGEMKTL